MVMKDVSNHKDFLPNTPPDKDSNPNDDFLFVGYGKILVKDLDHLSYFGAVTALQ